MNGPEARGTRSPGRSPPVSECTPPVAQNLEGLAFQGELQGHRVGPVGEVDDVVVNTNPMGVGDYSGAPRLHEIALPVKNHHRRVFPLEDIHSVPGVGGHRAGIAEGLAGGQLGPVSDKLVGILACSYGGHLVSSLSCWSTDPLNHPQNWTSHFRRRPEYRIHDGQGGFPLIPTFSPSGRRNSSGTFLTEESQLPSLLPTKLGSNSPSLGS